MTTAAPGWYPDTTMPGTQRWWDGSTWTDHRQPLPTAPEPSPPTPTPPNNWAPPTVGPAAAPEPQGGVGHDLGSSGDPSLDAERERWLAFAKREFDEMVAAFDAERADLERQISDLEAQLVDRHDQIDLQSMGFDHFDHDVIRSIEFKQAVTTARERRKELGRTKSAVTAATDWTVEGSAAKGRKMVDQFSKLMLRAYNNELDALLRTTKATNAEAKVTALTKKREQIRKLGASMRIEISSHYHDLAAYEIRQTGSFELAKQVEKELEREHREQLREQARVEKELAAAKAKLGKERQLHEQALEALRQNPDASAADIVELEAKLAEVEGELEAVDFREANTRAGYVYVISNPGSFGADVVKIGMTRRLDPMDRVRELGDASVPFRFVVHALIFADDAVTLEAELHRRFADARVNKVNLRREYFRTTPTEVRDALLDLDAHLLEFDETPESDEWEASR